MVLLKDTKLTWFLNVLIKRKASTTMIRLAPMIKLMTVRVVLSLAISQSLSIHQLDVHNTFSMVTTRRVFTWSNVPVLLIPYPNNVFINQGIIQAQASISGSVAAPKFCLKRIWILRLDFGPIFSVCCSNKDNTIVLVYVNDSVNK